MHGFNCDICDKRTIINPKQEPVFEGKEIVDPDDIGKTKIIQVPKMIKKEYFDQQSDEFKSREIHEHSYAESKCHLIIFNLGEYTIQRDYCTECYNEHIHSKAKEFFHFLHKAKK